MCVWVCECMANKMKEKFKFRSCLTVAHWNLQFKYLAYRCTNGCSKYYTSTRTHTHLIPHRDRATLDICKWCWEFCKHGNLNTKWVSNQHQCLKTSKAVENRRMQRMCTNMNITWRSQPYTGWLAHDSLKDFWLHPMSMRFDKCLRDAFIYFMLHFDWFLQ